MKVIFDFAKQQISIDGDASHLIEVLGVVREIAPSLTQIQIHAATGPAPEWIKPGAGQKPDAAFIGNNGPTDMPRSGTTMRQFAKQLRLTNACERAAAIAYYIKTHENRQVFSPKEMTEWFGFCGFSKPAQMSVVLFDAKRRYGYMDSQSHGQWRLTTNGDNLIIGKLNEAEPSPNQ